MPLAYYIPRATSGLEAFWTDHWGGHTVEELLAVARVSPLTDLVVGALRSAPPGPVLEAGCGLGQYVILLRERGWPAVGADLSPEALAACRRVARVPLARMELGALAVRDGAFAACVSLGVMEHDPDGPDRLLGETARVLAPGGVLAVSVPYWNGVRRLGTPWIRREARARAEAGGSFYQYAFSRHELAARLERGGFVVHAMHPYDPARLLRRWVPGALVRVPPPARPGVGAERPEARRARDRGLRALVRRLLYTPPSLALLGHMILAVAIRPPR